MAELLVAVEPEAAGGKSESQIGVTCTGSGLNGSEPSSSSSGVVLGGGVVEAELDGRGVVGVVVPPDAGFVAGVVGLGVAVPPGWVVAGAVVVPPGVAPGVVPVVVPPVVVPPAAGSDVVPAGGVDPPGVGAALVCGVSGTNGIS